MTAISLTSTYALPYLNAAGNGGRVFAALGTLESLQNHPLLESCGRPMRCTAGAIREVEKNIAHGYSKRGCLGPHMYTFENGETVWVTRKEYYQANRENL